MFWPLLLRMLRAADQSVKVREVGMRRLFFFSFFGVIFFLHVALPRKTQQGFCDWYAVFKLKRYRFATIQRIWNWIFFLLVQQCCLAFSFCFLPLCFPHHRFDEVECHRNVYDDQ